MNKNSLRFGSMMTTVAVAAVLAGVLLTAIYREDNSRARLLPDKVLTLLAHPKPLASFALTDQKNRVFDLARLQGKWTFLFFGYTHCPDVCPATLAIMAGARATIARSNAGAKDLQFVFVSVDPHRDTAAKLGQYVNYFDPTFIGATGSDAQVSKLAGQLDAAYEVTIRPGVENYPVFHSPGVFLVDPRARYHAVFTPPHDAEAISRRFGVLRELAEESAK